MKLRSSLFLAIAVATTASGQTTLQTGTQLVFVPTLVQTSAHDLAFSLAAKDFSLTDNGVTQHVTLEEQSTRPLALVVLIQTGGAARPQLDQYSHLDTMLEQILGKPPNQIAIVNFDSQPEGASPFTSNIADWTDAIDHPDPGDSGAAILDSLAFALRLLNQQPANARRAILLLCQSHDSGSKVPVRDVARALGESGTTLYTVTFSAEKSTLKQDFAGAARAHPPITVAGQTYVAYFDLSGPLSLALGAMRKNAAADLADLSGGEAAHFSNHLELDADLNTLANHIRNTYLLSFSPTAPTPGAHTLAVRLSQYPDLQVSSRTTYWIPEPDLSQASK